VFLAASICQREIRARISVLLVPKHGRTVPLRPIRLRQHTIS
jgi:hypothetical protein